MNFLISHDLISINGILFNALQCASISPSDSNYVETISTLRYAGRAKNIQNAAHINNEPKDALLRHFQEEIEDLKRQLEEGIFEVGSADEDGEDDEEEVEEDDDEIDIEEETEVKKDSKKKKSTKTKKDDKEKTDAEKELLEKKALETEKELTQAKYVLFY